MLNNSFKKMKMKASLIVLIMMAYGVTACSPNFNWRESRPFDDALMVQLPCKADTAQRNIQLKQQTLAIQMVGCEAQDMMFVVAKVTLPNKEQLPEIQAAWQDSLKQNIKANSQPVAQDLVVKKEISQKLILQSALTEHQVRYFEGLDSQNQPISLEILWWSPKITPESQIAQEGQHASSVAAKGGKVTHQNLATTVPLELYQMAVFYPTPKRPSNLTNEALQTFFQGLAVQ